MEQFLKNKKNKPQYQILELIGKGGFGEVYKAKNKTNRKIVAIKTFQKQLGQDEAEVDWEREAQQAISIKGKNVIESYEFSRPTEDIGSYYLVMEFADRGSLRTFMNGFVDKNELLDEATIVSLFRQVLGGLRIVHKTTLHRDIKPENMLFAGKILKISDFGLAKYVDEATRTRTYKGWGTYKYMAPESWSLGKITPATDIYSLGIVLYELATLKLPFSSADVKEIEEMHRFAGRPRVQAINTKISSRLDGIIYKMMKHALNDRYQSVDEIISELDSSTTQPDIGNLSSAVELAKKIHGRETQKELEEAKKLNEVKRRNKMNKVKSAELAEKLSKVVDEFNTSIPEEKINLSRDSETDFTLTWRGNDLLNLSINNQFYGDDLIIRGNRIVAYAGMSFRAPAWRDQGTNFILCVEGSEDYGTWKVMEVQTNPISREPQRQHIADWILLSHLSLHDYTQDRFTKTIRDDVEQEFRSMIEKAFEYHDKRPTRNDIERGISDDW